MMMLGPYQRHHQAAPRAARFWLGVLCVTLCVLYFNGAWPFSAGPEREAIDHERQTQPISDALQGSYLVVVEESEQRSEERLHVLNDHRFWFSLQARGMAGFRILDVDSRAAQSFVREARRRSLSHPFVMLVAADGRVIEAIAFPQRTETIEAILR